MFGGYFYGKIKKADCSVFESCKTTVGLEYNGSGILPVGAHVAIGEEDEVPEVLITGVHGQAVVDAQILSLNVEYFRAVRQCPYVVSIFFHVSDDAAKLFLA